MRSFFCLAGFCFFAACAKPSGSSAPPPAAAAAPSVQVAVQDLKGADGATVYAKVCAQCHGPEGRGNAALRAPSIAGMPTWYTVPQVRKFREGIRGNNPADPAGFLMRAIAGQLDDRLIVEACKHIENMPPARTANTLQGDPVQGKWKFAEYCMKCHRYNASGELVFGSPPLTRLPDWYMADQLRKFHNGLRGHHPLDEKGAKMAEVATYIYRPEDVRDILAYIAELAKQDDGKIHRRPRAKP